MKGGLEGMSKMRRSTFSFVYVYRKDRPSRFPQTAETQIRRHLLYVVYGLSASCSAHVTLRSFTLHIQHVLPSCSSTPNLSALGAPMCFSIHLLSPLLFSIPHFTIGDSPMTGYLPSRTTVVSIFKSPACATKIVQR